MQAVILGNYVMAAITDHDQDIQADSDHISEYLHEVSDQGLTTLVTSDGLLLCYSEGIVSFVEKSRCLSGMHCTFRLSQSSR